jgi:hypothetical protein
MYKIEYKKHYCLNLYFRKSKFYASDFSVQVRKSYYSKNRIGLFVLYNSIHKSENKKAYYYR